MTDDEHESTLSFQLAAPTPGWINDGPGNFPWDRWERKAIAAGVPEDLAQLGQAVYREAFDHGWAPQLKAECGWEDDGAAMIERATSDPDASRRRWNDLLASDGGFLNLDAEPQL